MSATVSAARGVDSMLLMACQSARRRRARPARAATRSSSRPRPRACSAAAGRRATAVGREDAHAVRLGPEPEPGSATSLATSRSTPLRCSLSTARSSEPVSAANPTRYGRGATAWAWDRRYCPCRARCGRSGRGCPGSARARGSAPAPRSSFLSAVLAGRKSATAAAMTRASKPAAPSASWVSRSSAARRSAVDSTRTIVGAVGQRRPRCWRRRSSPARRGRGLRPRSPTPIRPVDRLPMKRTGSIVSRVPPALTTTWRPARSASRGPATSGGRAAGSAARTGRCRWPRRPPRRSPASSASRPTPGLARSELPGAGLDDPVAEASRSRATLAPSPDASTCRRPSRGRPRPGPGSRGRSGDDVPGPARWPSRPANARSPARRRSHRRRRRRRCGRSGRREAASSTSVSTGWRDSAANVERADEPGRRRAEHHGHVGALGAQQP